MREIYLDDYHLHSLTTAGLPTKVDRGVTGLEAPDQRIDSYNNPGGHGQTVANILHGGRLVTMEGTIRGSSETEYRAHRAAFHQMVGARRTSSGSRYIPRILKLTDATGAQYRLSCVVQSLKNPDELPTHSRWQLQLLATDYLMYSEAVSTRFIYLPISGGMTIPFTFPATFGAASGGSQVVTNTGTMDTAPIIIFWGPLQNPIIYNNTTGLALGLQATLVAGDSISVNMAERTVIQGTSTNRMGYLMGNSRFWTLAPGENSISISADIADSGYVVIIWRSAYLGL